MAIPRKSITFASIILFFACAWGFPRTPLQNSNGQGELPSEIKGVRVYHLPEKSSEKTKGDLAVVRSVAYQDINLDHLALNLFVRMNPVDRPASVIKIYFQDLRANGMPVHVEPYETEFHLSKTAAVELPTPLRLSFVFAELESLEPLRQLVSKDVLHLTGHLFILVQLNTLESAVMRARQVVLPVNLDQSLPMHAFSEEPMIQSAVLKLLDSFSTPFSMGAAVLAKQRQQKLDTTRALTAAASGRVFLVYCGYSLRNPETHDVQRFAESGTAFVVNADGMLLTAKRVVQPWKFDSRVLALMNHSGYELDPQTYRLAAWPMEARVVAAKGELDITSALTTDSHTLELWKVAPDPNDVKPAESSGHPPETPQVHAEGSNDLALLKIVGHASMVSPLAPASHAETLSSATLLGFPFGIDQERAKLQHSDVSLMDYTSGSAAVVVHLKRALNPGEYGGPIVTADGKVIAICAGPKTCIPMAAALRSLEGVTALAIPSTSGGKKDVRVQFAAERREMLVLSLEEVHESLGAPKHDLPPDGVWQEVNPGGTFYTSDSARLKLATAGSHPPEPSQVTWYQRASFDTPWEVMGNGLGLAFDVAAKPGFLIIRVDVSGGHEHLSSTPVQYEIRQRLCPLLYKTTLDDIALGVATFREAKATTKTYKDVAAARGSIPKEIALLPDPDDPQKRPYQLADGDVVLRTGGALGYVQRSLGSPQSPQNHSGLIRAETYKGKSIYMVNEIGWGYEYTPLTPADAAAYQEIKSLPARPESFLEGANVGTLEVYRPVGMVQKSEGGTIAWQPYPIGNVVAARAVANGAKAQLGYDFLFMESSPIADQPPFQNLYYCHEFTREAFGRKMAKPAPIPILQNLWKAGRACDQEMAAANASGTAGDPAALSSVLSQIDVDHITFDPDPARNEAARNDFRNLINSLQRFLGGEPIEQLLKSKISDRLQEETISNLAEALLKGNSPGANIAPELQRILSESSLTELAKSSGLPEGHAALLGAAFHPAVQAWIAAGRLGAANLLTEDLYEDLGNAIDAKSLLEGGEATGANGESVRVTFKRISAIVIAP